MKKCFSTITAAAAALFIFTEAGMSVEPEEIQGSWRLAAVDGAALASAAENAPYFVIEGDEISGFDGCNRFGGTLGGAIIVGQRACMGDFVPLPLDLSDPVAHLGEARMEDGRLVLPARSGLPASTFERDA